VQRERLMAPSFLTIEVANALLQQARAGLLPAALAIAALRDVLELEIELVPIEILAIPALTLAIELGLSAYDASYVALAELRDVPLATADRRLAAAYGDAELLS